MVPPALFTCPSCQNHVKASESACPHCGARLGGDARLLRSATAVLMGLTLAACPGESKPEPEYGVPATESATGTTGMTTTGTTTTAGSTTVMTTAEPDYGVPATTSG